MARLPSTKMDKSFKSMAALQTTKKIRSGKTCRTLAQQLRRRNGQVGYQTMDRAAGAIPMMPLLPSQTLWCTRLRASNSDQRLRRAVSRPRHHHQPQPQLHQLHRHQASAHCNLELTVEAMPTVWYLLPHLKTAARSAKAMEDVQLSLILNTIARALPILYAISKRPVVQAVVQTCAPVEQSGTRQRQLQRQRLQLQRLQHLHRLVL